MKLMKKLCLKSKAIALGEVVQRSERSLAKQEDPGSIPAFEPGFEPTVFRLMQLSLHVHISARIIEQLLLSRANSVCV